MYTISPSVRLVEVKSSVPRLEFDEIVPDRSPSRPPLPTDGAVWSIVRVKVPAASPPVPVTEAVMSPALLFVGVPTVESTIPAYDSVRVLSPKPKVALLAPPLAEKPPVVENVTGSASAGVPIVNASADKASRTKTPEILRVMFFVFLSCLYVSLIGRVGITRTGQGTSEICMRSIRSFRRTACFTLTPRLASVRMSC